MPTGYTYKIEDGEITSAQDFVRMCARAVGPFGLQREESLEVPPRIPEPFDEEQSWYSESVRAEREKIIQLARMSKSDIAEAYSRHVEQRTKEDADQWQQYEERLARYSAILEKVEAWQPHPDAEPLKQFCIDQIKTSLPYEPHEYQIEVSPEAWWEAQTKMATRSLVRSLESLEERKEMREQAIELAKNILASIEDVEH